MRNRPIKHCGTGFAQGVLKIWHLTPRRGALYLITQSVQRENERDRFRDDLLERFPVVYVEKVALVSI